MQASVHRDSKVQAQRAFPIDAQGRLPCFLTPLNPHLTHTNNRAGQRYWLLMCRHRWGCRYRCLACKAANCLSVRPAAGRYVAGGDGVWVGVGAVVVAWGQEGEFPRSVQVNIMLQIWHTVPCNLQETSMTATRACCVGDFLCRAWAMLAAFRTCWGAVQGQSARHSPQRSSRAQLLHAGSGEGVAGGTAQA